MDPLLPNLSSPQDQNQITDLREIGATGLRRFSGFVYDEFLPELVGWKGAAIYKEMSYNEPVISSILFAITMLCRQVDFFSEPASQDKEDLAAAEFLDTCMNDMDQPWTDTLVEILSMITYGYSPHEIVYKRRCGDVIDPSMRSQYTDGRVGWRKWPIRSQDTIYRWQFDDHGGIQGLEQLAPPHYFHVTIPTEKLLLFRTTNIRNNPEGLSCLRGAYRHWYMMKNIENIEAIGVERDLAGLPCAWVPPEILSANASPGQKNILAMIQQATINVRRNQQEGMIMPLDYDQISGKPRYDFKLLSTGGSRQFDTSAIINRYAHRISINLLGDFLLIGQQSVGSFALITSKTDLFTTAIGAFLDMICSIINRYAVPRLFQLNDFRITKYPQLKRGRVGNVNLEDLSNYINKLTGSGMQIFPTITGDLERYLLDVAKVPSEGVGTPPPSPGQSSDAGILPNSEGKTQVTVPLSPIQIPNGAVNDRTPADGQPKAETVTTNISGSTENTGKSPNKQDENQSTPNWPLGAPWQ